MNIKLQLQLKKTLPNVLLSTGLHTSLAESFSNYDLKEQKNIDLVTKQKQSLRGILQNSSSSIDVRNFEKYLRRSTFFGQN